MAQTPEERELKAIARFYKDSKYGFCLLYTSDAADE